MDLACRLDQILQMCPRQEVSERHKLAMVLIFHIDQAPSVLSTAHRTAVDDNGVLGSNHREGYQVLDIGVHGALFLVLLVIVVGVHAQIVKSEFFLYALFESLAFLEGERVGLGDDRDDVDDVRELLEHDDVNGLEAKHR